MSTTTAAAGPEVGLRAIKELLFPQPLVSACLRGGRRGLRGPIEAGAPPIEAGAPPIEAAAQWEGGGASPRVSSNGRRRGRGAPRADWPPGGERSGAERGGHDCAQLRAAARPLLRLLGARGRRRPLVRAQGAQPRGDHHHAGHHRRVLLPLLADRHPGAGQPAVRAAAEERDRLVRALPLGVNPAPQRRAPRHHPPAAAPASPLPSQAAPGGAGPEAGPTAPVHPELCIPAGCRQCPWPG